MLGRHHLTLSVSTVAIVALPLFTLYPMLVLLVLLGATIGSLIPDADSSDAAIFHSEVRGLKGGYGEVLNPVAVLNPLFGHVTKYLIYKPAIWFYDTFVFSDQTITERHRGFLHSILGLVTTTVLTGLYLIPVLFLLELLSLLGLAVFLAGYLAGALLHLLEDSCTRTGIQWNFPFQSWRLKGQLRTTAQLVDRWRQESFQVILGGLAVAMFFAPSVLEGISDFLLSVAGFVLVAMLWTGFAVGIARCRVHPA